MKVEYEETVVVKRFKVVCDFCGYEKIESWSMHGQCAVCKKHGCFKCGEFFYEGGIDRPQHYACSEHAEIVRKAYYDVF